MTENSFYENNVLVEDFDFTVVAESERAREFPGTVKTRLRGMAAAIAMSSMLTFGPCSVSAPDSVRAFGAVESVTVHLRGPAQKADLEQVEIPVAHRQAAERVRKLFRTVPLSEAEKLPDPDFNL